MVAFRDTERVVAAGCNIYSGNKDCAGSASAHKKAIGTSITMFEVSFLYMYMKSCKSIMWRNGVISRCITNFNGCWITSSTTSFIVSEQPNYKNSSWLASRHLNYLVLEYLQCKILFYLFKKNKNDYKVKIL